MSTTDYVPTSKGQDRADGGRRLAAPFVPQLLLGIGFGGLVDGVVLHQVLQWHHMLSATDDHPTDTVRGLEANTLADGLFHVGAFAATVAGLFLLIRAWQHGRIAPPWRAHVGALLIGWGVFNLVEGLVDHHLLQVHNVRDDVADPAPWNIAFLALSAALVAAGLALRSRGARAEDLQVGLRSTVPG